MEPQPVLNTIGNLGKQIVEIMLKIDALYQSLAEIHSNYPPLLLQYGNYLMNVQNDPALSANLITHYAKLVREKSGADDSTIERSRRELNESSVVICSGSKDTYGQIVMCDEQIFNISGYFKSELLKRNISVLIPPVISEAHTSLIVI